MIYIVVLPIVLLVTLLIGSPAHAATYYVKTSGSDANSCATAQTETTPKLTVAAGMGCLSAGDTLEIGAGSYTLAAGTTITGGSSDTVRTTMKAMSGNSVTVTFAANGNHGLNVPSNTTLSGIDWDGTNIQTAGLNAIKITTQSNITITGPAPTSSYACKIHGSRGVAFNVQGTTSNIRLENCEVYDSDNHGIYIQRATGFVMEGNYVHDNGCLGIQLYPNTTGGVMRRNVFTHNSIGTLGCTSEVILANTGHTFERNIIYNASALTYGLRLQYSSPSNVLIQNNTIYGPYTNCIYLEVNSSAVTVRNNITLGCTTKIQNLGTGNTLTTNLTTGTASDVFTSVTGGAEDLTLKSGSAAINGGTVATLPYCGSAPDQGAYETPVVTAAAIFGNTLDVTVCNIAPPIQPSGTWTPGCTGAGCGTPVSSDVSVTGGGLVRVSVSGITGGNCAAGQTWTIGASGANTDTAHIGLHANQKLPTVTGFAVDSSACDASGRPSYPGSQTAYYMLDGNTNDSSGNANHAIGSASISYGPAKYGQGVQFTEAVSSYVDTGLLNGYTLGSSSLTIAVGVRLTSSDLGRQRAILGATFNASQRLLLWKSSSNTWRASVGTVSGGASEFSVTEGDTHLVLQFDAATNTAKLCVNGVEGAVTDASTFSYSDFSIPSTVRLGVPSGYSTSLSGEHIVDDVLIYQSVVSCAALYAAWNPQAASIPVTQAAHQWQGVFLSAGAVENRGAASAQRTVVRGGAVALQIQLNNTSGGAVTIQPRFRYNINGGEFANVVPDSPTVDGVAYWGHSVPSGLNNGVSDGPISGVLSHTDGITLVDSLALPTANIPNNGSYTLSGIFTITAAVGDVVCFKAYDQSGEALASYTPAAGACVTVLTPEATGSW